MIVTARKHSKLDFEQLRKIGVVLKRAQYFIYCLGSPLSTNYSINPITIRQMLINSQKITAQTEQQQLSFIL